MHSRLTPVHDISRLQRRQVLQPQTGGLCLSVPEHPGLDDLVRLPDTAADDADRVFDADALDGSIHQIAHEL